MQNMDQKWNRAQHSQELVFARSMNNMLTLSSESALWTRWDFHESRYREILGPSKQARNTTSTESSACLETDMDLAKIIHGCSIQTYGNLLRKV